MKKLVKIAVLTVFCILFVNSVFAEDYSGTFTMNGKTYYRDEHGVPVKDEWVYLNDGWHYFKYNSEMAIGWLLDEKNKRTYFLDNKDNLGVMIGPGFHIIDGYYRYFNEDSSLAYSTSHYRVRNLGNGYYVDDKANVYTLDGELLPAVPISQTEYFSFAIMYSNMDLRDGLLSDMHPEYNAAIPIILNEY